MSRRPRKLILERRAGALSSANDPALPGTIATAPLESRTWPRVSASGGPHGPPWSITRTTYFGITDVGMRRRDNEDAFLADQQYGLFVVCDGVGGRPFGEVAAQEAVSVIWNWVRREMQTIGPAMREAHELCQVPGSLGMLAPCAEVTARLESVVRTAIQHASHELCAMARADNRYLGMCTTASVALVAGEVAVVGQVGDSRVYHARGPNVRQLTEDHTLQSMLVKQGIVRPDEARARRSPITRALGLQEAVEVDIVTVPVAVGDRLLLCSDGLHEYFDREKILSHLLQLDVQAAGLAAVRHANKCGGRDNITALFVEILGNA